MSELGIDLNRGFVYSKTMDGVQVGYYPDDPCAFYAMNGLEVPASFAQMAFPAEEIARLAKKCEYKRRLSEAAEAIREELEEAPDEQVVIEERGGLKVIDIGLGRARVVDDSGQPLHTQELTKEQAVNLLHKLVPDAPGVPETGKKA